MKFNHMGSAVWSGGVKDGRGAISTESGALQDYPYGFARREDGRRGSNPEELLGAAHAACFTMALSGVLERAGLIATRLETKATITLEKLEGGYAVTASHLTLEGTVPGADEAKFQELAQIAKANCPLSKVMKADISLDAKLSE
jgi:osmotically inducible protein OsmC